MKAKSLILVIASAVLVVACSPEPPRYFGPPQESAIRSPLELLFTGVSPAAINSDAFAKRQPHPGQLGYLETIRFINDGVKYIDPFAEFFVSPDGQMCFRGLVNRQMLEFENYQSYWCIYPDFVNNVEELENNITNVNSVRLWCVLQAPQCPPDRGLELFGRESVDRQQHIGADPSLERATRGNRASDLSDGGEPPDGAGIDPLTS